MITTINTNVEKLIDLVSDYEDSIINEESSKKQMQMYLKIDRYITKNGVSHEDELQALNEVGAASPMSVLHDWYIDLEYRMEDK